MDEEIEKFMQSLYSVPTAEVPTPKTRTWRFKTTPEEPLMLTVNQAAIGKHLMKTMHKHRFVTPAGRQLDRTKKLRRVKKYVSRYGLEFSLENVYVEFGAKGIFIDGEMKLR